MILWYLLGYLVIGLLSVYGAALIHLVKAEMKGYAALDFWVKHSEGLKKHSEGLKAAVTSHYVVLGLMIWPERLVNFVCNLAPEWYELYDLKDEL